MTVPARTVSPARAVAVTAGLSAAGAMFGAAAGATALGIVLALSDGFHALRELAVLAVPGVLGGVIGAICAPLAGWLLLRRIPLGRAFLGLTVGTVVGGVVGWYLVPQVNGHTDALSIFNLIIRPVLGATLGFLSAAFLMRFRHRRQTAQVTIQQ